MISPKKLDEIAANAKQYILDNHSHTNYARHIADTINLDKQAGESKADTVATYIHDKHPRANSLIKFIESIY